MTRSATSIITQLRTQHVPLAAYLHRFNLAESPTCQQCHQSPETVEHYIKYCRAYKKQRRALKYAIGHATDVGTHLLGTRKNIRHLLKYIHDTKRFFESHGNLRPESQTQRTNTDDPDDETAAGITWG
ncbi:hypothetical protein HYPSUDRAFT_126000 [Hypholoma sublateritium FD-334 SS-4]|uniref:Reverse transcriptase zinc-binding domain-containing protein n=1 Tax=Hypholoma sublateritium (strain FD-334 SS-4) TaxID=945553 RepID=A0A0D2LP69_HYPSF|nr:hypothetical protein HYPSUDRAFT_143678 [Hypholoma sublateritium FD-334 SS-4]KJA29877.1 hypothetical protein HYPSUDRAFT_126000 [Hypholoma sublateritium FD-334 SS-4]